MTAGENPFAPGNLRRRLGFDPALAGTSWQDLEERWCGLGRRAAITGRRGSGKSSLLEAWAGRWPEPPLRLFFNDQRCRIGEEQAALLEACGGRVVVIDGAGHLPWRERRLLRRLTAPARGVVVSRHRAGEWPELIRLRSTPELAQVLLDRIDPGWRCRPGASFDQRWRACRGNLREFFFACYDALARPGG
jgi:hypothetical protein